MRPSTFIVFIERQINKMFKTEFKLFYLKNQIKLTRLIKMDLK